MSTPPAPEAPLACPRCGAAVDRRQEYCLDCGHRLPLAARAVRAPQPSTWLLPALLGLVVAIVGTALAIALSDAARTEAAVSVATGGSRTATGPAETLTAPEPLPEAPPPATTAPPSTTPRPANRPITWPREDRGWTIVLLSLPQSAGRDLAEQRATEAIRRGLRNVGVLNSSRYASLHPGYFVVFTGIFESQAEAVSALQRARAAFPNAYQREIVP